MKVKFARAIGELLILHFLSPVPTENTKTAADHNKRNRQHQW